MEEFTFKSITPLAEGAFGKVYLGRGLGGRDVALKVLPFSKKREEMADIWNEITIHSNLPHHENIIQMHSWFYDSINNSIRNICLVLEYASGNSLYNLYKEKEKSSFTASESAKYMKDVVNGLKCIHENNVIHRDMKMENLMLVGPDEKVKIGDFGFATNINDHNNTLCGTDIYKSPEMVVLGQRYNEGVDIWAVGVLLYEFLSGTTPFGRNDEDEEVGWSSKYSTIIWPQKGVLSANSLARDLITNLLKEVPLDRISLADVLTHNFLSGDDEDVNSMVDDDNSSTSMGRQKDTEISES